MDGRSQVTVTDRNWRKTAFELSQDENNGHLVVGHKIQMRFKMKTQRVWRNRQSVKRAMTPKSVSWEEKLLQTRARRSKTAWQGVELNLGDRGPVWGKTAVRFPPDAWHRGENNNCCSLGKTGTGSRGTAAENWLQRGSRGKSIMARSQGRGQRPREGWKMLSLSAVQQRPEQDSCWERGIRTRRPGNMENSWSEMDVVAKAQMARLWENEGEHRCCVRDKSHS